MGETHGSLDLLKEQIENGEAFGKDLEGGQVMGQAKINLTKGKTWRVGK